MLNAFKATAIGVVLASAVGSVMAQSTDIQVIARLPGLLTISDIPTVELDLKDEDISKEVSFDLSDNTGTVKVLLTGSNGVGDNGSFLLKKGEETIKFSLEYKAGAGYFEPIANNVEKVFDSNDKNHTIKFNVAKADWSGKTSGEYNETLTLTMSQE